MGFTMTQGDKTKEIDYKGKIIELVANIENEDYLRHIYIFAKASYEREIGVK